MKSILARVKAQLRAIAPRVYESVPVPVERSCEFAGRSVLVAGGGRVGHAVSKAFLETGAKVRQIDRVPGLAPDGAIEVLGDLSDLADIDRLWSEFSDQPDILVHAAGYQPPVIDFDLQDEGEWLRTFNTNVLGLIKLSQLFGKSLIARKQPGSAVLLSSTHHAITGGWPVYAASKAAIVRFMSEIALEWAPLNIRVNVIAPGWVAGPNERNARDYSHMPLHQQAIAPEIVANSVLLLSSDVSTFTTGAVLTVDGGLSLRSYRTPAKFGPNDPHIRRSRHEW